MVQRLPSDVLERIATSLSVDGRGLATEHAADVGRALADLAERIDRAAEVVQQLIHLINPQVEAPDVHLTPRELELLTHLSEGRSNAEIARTCWVSENTVKFHLKNIFKKLDVRDRGQAIMIARAIQRKVGYPSQK